MNSHNQGFIALSTVLVVTAILLVLTIGITSRSIFLTSSNSAFLDCDVARYIAHGCLDHARMELQRTVDYAGGEVILIGEGSCEIIEIEGTGNFDRVLNVKAHYGSLVYEVKETIDQISPRMVITSSEQVI